MMNLEGVKSFNAAHDYISVRLLPTEYAKKRYLDVALKTCRELPGNFSYAAFIQLSDNYYAPVTKEMIISWDVPSSWVFECGFERLKNETYLANMISFEKVSIDKVNALEKKPEILCITNKDSFYGAACVFFHLEKLCKLFDTDRLYIAFTSAHECVVHDARETKVSWIKDAMVSMMDMVEPGEFLTDRVFEFTLNPWGITEV